MPDQPAHKVTAYGTVTPPPDPDGAESADDEDQE